MNTRRLVLLLLLTACGGTPTKPTATHDSMSPIITRYQQVLVLAAESDSLPAREQALVPVVGRMLFEQNQVALDALKLRLVGKIKDAPTPLRSPREVTRFLDWLEKDPSLRDADKLAVRGVVISMTEATAARNDAPALSARLARVQNALKEIHDLHAGELAATHAKIGVKRGLTIGSAAWSSYVDWLRTRYNAREIIEAAHSAPMAAPEVTPPPQPRPGDLKTPDSK